jgi:hypothetical protein
METKIEIIYKTIIRENNIIRIVLVTKGSDRIGHTSQSTTQNLLDADYWIHNNKVKKSRSNKILQGTKITDEELIDWFAVCNYSTFLRNKKIKKILD